MKTPPLRTGDWPPCSCRCGMSNARRMAETCLPPRSRGGSSRAPVRYWWSWSGGELPAPLDLSQRGSEGPHLPRRLAIASDDVREASLDGDDLAHRSADSIEVGQHGREPLIPRPRRKEALWQTC